MNPGLKNRKKQPPEVFNEKGALSFTKLTGKHLCPSLFFSNILGLRPATLLKKKTLTQVFSCQFYETFENTFLRVTAFNE